MITRPNREPDLAIHKIRSYVKSEFWFDEEIVALHYNDGTSCYETDDFSSESEHSLTFNDWIKVVMESKAHPWSHYLTGYFVEKVLLGENGDH